MKALSIKQPWAWAIMDVKADKDVENRHWRTHFRGTIAVHASQSMTRNEYDEFLYIYEELIQKPCSEVPIKNAFAFGAIIGTVEIVDCVTAYNSAWFFGDYGFILQNPKSLVRPIKCKGALGFWEVPKEIEAQMEFEK